MNNNTYWNITLQHLSYSSVSPFVDNRNVIISFTVEIKETLDKKVIKEEKEIRPKEIKDKKEKGQKGDKGQKEIKGKRWREKGDKSKR